MFLRCYVNQQLIKVINISTKYAVDNLAKHGRDSGNSGFLGGLIVDNRSNFCGKLFEKLITLYYWIGLCRLKCFTLCADFIYVSDGRLKKTFEKVFLRIFQNFLIAFFDEGLPIIIRELFFCASLSPSSKKVVKSSKDSKEASQEFS
jgi:hypothetical protein